MAVRVDRSALADSLPAYPSIGGLLVPLGQLTAILGFEIRVDVAGRAATGFFIREDRPFLLDGDRRSVKVGGKELSFDADSLEVHEDDIYVDTRLLAKWFPIDVTVDFPNLRLDIHAREPLPAQMRKMREEAMRKSLAGRGRPAADSPVRPDPYRLWDGPFVDETLGFDLQRPRSGPSSWNVQNTTYLTADFLWQELRISATGDRHAPASDVRVSLGRRDPDGHLLGFVGAREYALGEVLFSGDDLVSIPASGPGFLVSTFPLQRSSQFGRQTFRGALAPGWEVELYQNDTLVAYQQSRADGFYEFDDVPLNFGFNLFRLVFYGPQGQRREEGSRFNIGESLTPPGKVNWRLVGNDPKNATRRSLLDVEAGISRNLTAVASASTVDFLGATHGYGKAGLRAFWSLLYAAADFVHDTRGGNLVSLQVQTRVGPVQIALQRAQLSGYASEQFLPTLGLIHGRTLARFNGIVPAGWLPAIPIQFQFQRDEFAAGGHLDKATNRVSISFHRFFVSNQIELDRLRIPGTSQDRAFGDLLASKYLRRFALRGELLYDVRPDRQLKNLVATAETLSGDGLVYRAGVNRFLQTKQTHFLFGVNKSQGAYGLGANGDYSSATGLTVALSVNVALGFDSRTRVWHAQARPMAASGAFSALAFLDTNGNGVRDPGEPPLEGVALTLQRSRQPGRTGKNGVVFVPNAPNGVASDVSLDTSTLEDPSAIPELEAIRVVARPGKTIAVDFPVYLAGEITGTVTIRGASGRRDGAGLSVQLVSPDNKELRRTLTAYDGFYDITTIRPGTYRLRIDPDDLKRLELSPSMEREIVFAPSGTTIDGADIVLVETLRAEAAASDEVVPPVAAPVSVSDAKSIQPPFSAPAAIPGPPAQPLVLPAWTIQLEAVRQPWAVASARRLERSLSLRFLPLTTARGTFTRVLFGRYPTRQAAVDALDSVPAVFRKNGNVPYVIREPAP